MYNTKYWLKIVNGIIKVPNLYNIVYKKSRQKTTYIM